MAAGGGRGGLTHPPRPPIPIARLDARAAGAVRERLGGRGLGRLEVLAAWLAAVTGADPPVVRPRIVVAGAGGEAGAGRDTVAVPAVAAAARDPRREAAMSVGEVAAAVDAGRDLAAAAAADGVTVLAAAVAGAAAATAAGCLAALLAGDRAGAAGPDPGVADAVALHAPLARGPLGALRRVGTPEVAVACGLALGAGEHGLGLLCDGPAATAGAAVAVAIEPDLLPRLLAADTSPAPAHAALLAHLALDPVLALGTSAGDGAAAAAALAVLQVAARLAA